MKSFYFLFLIAGCCASSIAQEPVPDPSPVDPAIKLPMDPGATPQPGPVPAGVVTKLTPDKLYVVTANVPLIILQSPDAGLIKITSVASPRNFFAKFADGTGDYESRDYTDPHIYVLTGIKSGNTELLLIPEGVKVAESIVRQVLTVSGIGPNPPPGPDPPPDPDPPPGPDPPKPPGPVTSFRVIFVKESGSTLSAEQTAIPGAKVIRDYLLAKTTPEGGLAGWREYDPEQNTTNEQPTMKALWAAVKPKITTVPCIVVEVNGHATVMPLPANAAEALTLLKNYGGA